MVEVEGAFSDFGFGDSFGVDVASEVVVCDSGSVTIISFWSWGGRMFMYSLVCHPRKDIIATTRFAIDFEISGFIGYYYTSKILNVEVNNIEYTIVR